MIGKRLIALAKAISDHEGWGPDDLKTLGVNEETPSWRNNNPGNLTYSPFAIGNRGRFAYFYNEDVGYFALLLGFISEMPRNDSNVFNWKQYAGTVNYRICSSARKRHRSVH